MIKIAFFDIDGTLASNNKKSQNTMDRIPKSALQALDKLKENGITPVIATGRGRVGILDFMKDLGLDSFIAANGQSVVYKNEEVYHYYIDKDVVYECLLQVKEIKDAKVGLETTIGRVLCYDNGDDELRVPFKAFLNGNAKGSYDYDVYQLCIYGEHLKNRVNIGDIGDLETRVVGPTAVNILSQSQSKQTGIEKMLEILGLKKEEAICFGDEENDLGMFDAVGVSVCMKDGNELLKRKATYVTDSVDNDGIYKACEHFGLI